MNDQQKIEQYIESLILEQLKKLANVCLTELVFTDTVRYNDENKYFYWETCGDNLIK